MKGNPGLKTESSNCYELGISRDLPGSSTVDLTGFYIKAKDFIQKDEDTQINDRDKTRFRGFEVSAGTRALPAYACCGWAIPLWTRRTGPKNTGL